MNWVILLMSLIVLLVAFFMSPNVKTIKKKVTCTKIIDSSSIPLLKPCETGEICEYGEESGHDIHECEEFGYIYTINNVDYSKDGRIITSKTVQDSPTVMTKEIDVNENDYTTHMVLGVGGVSGIILSIFI